MDGYSVNEAAAVLGIPEGRVWELLARGVLAGSTEVGGDMRVVLRSTTLAESPTPASSANGGHAADGGANGGGNGGELSPFRELLTEFRNLTERYGQSLLALGEARGEVASLRGRVELLEARVELRLPRVDAPGAVWEPEPGPQPDLEPEPHHDELAPEPAVEPAETAAPATPEPMPSAPPTRRRSRKSAPSTRPYSSSAASRSQSRAAVSGFAEALARAEDPTTADVALDAVPLPGAQEAADALAAYRGETGAIAAEPVVAETAAVAKAAPAPFVRAGYSTATPEPDWIAEEDLVSPAVRVRTSVDAAVAIAVAEPPPEPDKAVALSMPVTADEWAGPEADLAPEATLAPEPLVEELASSDAPMPEIAAEPPAPDDAALVDASILFSEPPIVPREPAFWEPEGRSRAPFATPNMETWEPAEIEALRAEITRVAPTTVAPTTVAPTAVAPTAVAPTAVAPPPVVAPAAVPAPPPTAIPVSGSVTAPRGTARGPAARAVRRLRRLLG